jgi:hypothetical protein
MAKLTKVYGSSSQAYKYVRLATGLGLVAVFTATKLRFDKTEIPSGVKFYKIAPDGEALLDRLEKFDDQHIIEQRLVVESRLVPETEGETVYEISEGGLRKRRRSTDRTVTPKPA